MLRTLFALSFLLVLIGCGGSDSAPAGGGAEDEGCGCGYEDEGCGCGEEEDEGAAGGGDYTPDKGTATIKGVVKFDGKVPKRRVIDMGSEKYCVNCYAEGDKARSEAVIVGDDGALKNVIVSIKYGLRGWKFETPTSEVLLDQSKCHYVPHVLGMQAGQKLRIRNSDPIMHNVHALPFKSMKTEFNLSQTQQGQEDVASIRKPGIYKAKCEVHGWMSSYIGVFKHPFFHVTGEDGAFTLAKVPPGEYTIEAWHEKYGALTKKIKVGDGETGEVNFSFSK